MSTDEQTYPRDDSVYRPERVDALASTVISLLRDRQTVSYGGLRQFVVDHLVTATLSRGHCPPDGLLAELRAHRLTVDAILDQYIPTAARELGRLWVEDSIGFADVTIGMMRLQSLVGEASSAVQLDVQPIGAQLHALVVVPRGEQHFLGSTVLAGQLRRMGCEVTMSFDEEPGSVKARVMQETPDLVLITCARRETLESVANTVQAIRAATTNGPMVAIGGAIKMKKEDVKARTGVDVVTSIAQEAVALCAQRAAPPGAL